MTYICFQGSEYFRQIIHVCLTSLTKSGITIYQNRLEAYVAMLKMLKLWEWIKEIWTYIP